MPTFLTHTVPTQVHTQTHICTPMHNHAHANIHMYNPHVLTHPEYTQTCTPVAVLPTIVLLQPHLLPCRLTRQPIRFSLTRKQGAHSYVIQYVHNIDTALYMYTYTHMHACNFTCEHSYEETYIHSWIHA